MVTLTDLKEALREVLGFGAGEIGREALRTTLREELDLHDGFFWTNYLTIGLDGFFYGRTWNLDNTESAVIPSDYWKQITNAVLSDGEYRSPSTVRGVDIGTRRIFPYGVAAFRTKLPTLTADGQYVRMGFRNDSGDGQGTANLFWTRIAGVEHLLFQAGGAFYHNTVYIDAALPADAKTVRHIYTIIVTKAQAELYIDDALVAVMINASGLNFTNKAYPPYAVSPANTTFTPHMVAAITVTGQGVELIHPIAPSNTRISQGDPLPPRMYRLYEEYTSTLLAGKEMLAGSVSSHAVPIFGYPTKTLYFRANQSGSIYVQMLTETDTYRTYNTTVEDRIVTADELYSYTILGAGVIARIRFTPDAYPCTISEAEMVMNQ